MATRNQASKASQDVEQKLRQTQAEYTAARPALERGVKPVLLPSHQFVGNTSAEEQLERFYEAYRKSLAHLFQ